MPDLPSGTVTFLITDIEGSTALWERDRAAMAIAVDRHIAVLEAAIQEHGGIHFKTVGDAVQAAFPTAPQSVAAALEGQRSLRAEDWRAIGPLQVRMALHAGEAIPDARGDYLAAPLNRLSRLLSTGYGGQILLSQTVQQLTRGALPEAVELRDLGEHRLRDLLEPEQVFQLLHPDLPDEFAPLKSLENRPHNLPRQPTPFLGREREVGEIVGLLEKDEVQLLSLVGPGGTGKTRLALQAAAELLDDFADGVFFVPLAPLTDPELVLPTIAATLGIHEEGGQPLGERLRDFLTTKQLLLLLDNVEHLVDAAPAVGELLRTAPRLKVLATSRMPLRLRAEREYPVSPLGLPRRRPPPTLEQLSQYEAVRLFIDRAQAVKPDFAIDNENAPAIAEICHRLDGLPLAIELAAARVRMLPPQAMLTRLEQRLPLLTSGARDAPERQRTLRHTIAWSYDLLAPDEQCLFRRIAVFAGGASFEAVEAVANPDHDLDVFGGLERLLEQSLLRQEEGLDGEPRFAMLETIREFGLEQLDADGEEATRQHHAAFFLALAEDADEALTGPEQGTWLARLEADHDNLRSALTWMLDHDPGLALRCAGRLARFWERRGHFGEGRAWLDRVLAAVSEPAADRARALTQNAVLAAWQGDLATAKSLLEEGDTLARSTGNDRAAAHGLLVRSATASMHNDFSTATSFAEQSLLLSRRVGDEEYISGNLSNLGMLAHLRGELVQATEFLEESLAIARRRGDLEGILVTGANVGDLACEQGKFDQAATLFHEALVLANQLGNPGRIAEVLSSTAMLAGKTERPSAAAQLFGAVERIRGEIGAPLSPMQQDEYNSEISAVCDQLGDTAFRAAWEAGQVLSAEEAVAEALALTDELAAGVQTGVNAV